MCRSIKKLRMSDRPVTDEEVAAAARQFVRKISGYRHPSKANEVVFEQAILEISQSSRHLLENLITRQTKRATPLE